jgi:hypothetical protein
MKFYIHNVDIDIPMEDYAPDLAQFGFRRITEKERDFDHSGYCAPADYIIELNTAQDFEELTKAVGSIVVYGPDKDSFGNFVLNGDGDKVRDIIIYDDYLE